MKTSYQKTVFSVCVIGSGLLAWNSLGEVWLYTPASVSNAFVSAAESANALGYRAISLSSASDRLGAAWLRDYAPAELQLFIPYESLQTNLLSLQAKGYRPVSVTVFGQVPDESYLVSYIKDGKESSLFTRLGAAELGALASSMPSMRVAWIATSGMGDNATYAALLAEDGLTGQIESGLEKMALESKLSSYRQAGYRPVCILAVGEASGMTYTANWVQEAKRWTNAFDLSAVELNSFLTWMKGQKLRPEVITQYLAIDQQTMLFSVVAVEDLAPVWTIIGSTGTGLDEFDRAMTNAMRIGNCTRAGLAVSKDGRLILSRGYTHHPENMMVTHPTNLFRVASISKPVTAVTVMGLVEAGKLQLDDKLGKYLDLSGVVDSRWTNITIRHLLQHRGGWNASATYDPTFYDATISAALGVPLPITKDHILTYMKRQRLQGEPGRSFAYSNFGYMLLSRVIEMVTGEPYEAFVRRNVLAPLGIYSARLGRTARADQLPGEVEYEEGSSTYPSVLSPERPRAASPYGMFNLENLDSCGGWVFNAEDLVRFVSAFTEKTNSSLLDSNTIEVMWSPAPEQQLPATGLYNYYGCGWMLQITNRETLPRYAIHGGQMWGATAFSARQSDGYCWAALFNTWNPESQTPVQGLNLTLNTAFQLTAVDNSAIVKAIAGVKEWPTNNLFESDGDGLPDTYERTYFGTLTMSDGTDDQDGDGLSDEAEWVLMSSPVDPAESTGLRIHCGPDNLPFLEVRSCGGRIYSVHEVSALGQTWDDSSIFTQFTGDGFTRALKLDAIETNRFFRLSVSPRAKP